MADVIHHLAELRGRELNVLAAKLPAGGGDRLGAAMRLLWESFTGPLALVAMELRTAARTDDELRRELVTVERTVRDNIGRQWRRLFGEEVVSGSSFDLALDFTLQVMIGMAMSASLHPDPGRVQRMLHMWNGVFLQMVNMEMES